MDNKKYTFTGNTIEKEGKKYFEIVAAKTLTATDGTTIPEGTILGAIEDESCLSQRGACIICDGSFVGKGIVVEDNAVVKNSFLKRTQIISASVPEFLDETIVTGNSVLNECNLELRLGKINNSVLNGVETTGMEIFHARNSSLENCSLYCDCLFFNSHIENLISMSSVVFKDSICRITNNTSYRIIPKNSSRDIFHVFERMFVENSTDFFSVEDMKYIYKRKDKNYALAVTDSLGNILSFREERPYVFTPFSLEEFLGEIPFCNIPSVVRESWEEIEKNAIKNFVNGVYGHVDKRHLVELTNLARTMQYYAFKEMLEKKCHRNAFCNGLVLNFAERKISKVLPEYFYIPSWGVKIIGERRQSKRKGGICVSELLSS